MIKSGSIDTCMTLFCRGMWRNIWKYLLLISQYRIAMATSLWRLYFTGSTSCRYRRLTWKRSFDNIYRRYYYFKNGKAKAFASLLLFYIIAINTCAVKWYIIEAKWFNEKKLCNNIVYLFKSDGIWTFPYQLYWF